MTTADSQTKLLVIASHNNVEFLEKNVQRLSERDLCGYQRLFIDTNSDSKEFQDAMERMYLEYPQFYFTKMYKSTRDSGAYIYAFFNHYADRYLLFQDSIYVEDPEAICKYDKLLDKHPVVALCDFDMAFDDLVQRQWASEGPWGTDIPQPKKGIFGPIFGIRNEVIIEIPVEFYLRKPRTKNQACGMERRWAMLFEWMGVPVHAIYHNLQIDNTFLAKTFALRQ